MDILSDIMGHDGLGAALLAGAVLVLLAAAVVPVGRLASFIAREKGYSGRILVLAWLPGVNICALLILMNMPDPAARAKIDALAVKLTPPSAAKRMADEELGR